MLQALLAPFARQLSTEDALVRSLTRGLAAGAGVVLVRGIGAVLIYASQIILARSLAPAEAGAYWLALPAATLASFAMSGGFMMGAVRFVPDFIEKHKPELARGYFRQGILISCLAGLAVVALAGLAYIAGALPVAAHFYPLVLLTAAVATPLAIHNFMIDFQRGLHRPVQAFVLQSLVNPVLVAAAMLLLAWLGSANAVTAMAATLAIACLLALMQILLIRRSDGAWLFSKAPQYATRQWIRAGLPLAATALAGNLVNWIDLFIVGLLLPIEQAAIYSVVGRVFYVLQFFGSSVTSGVAAQYSRILSSSGAPGLRSYVPRITAIVVLVNIVMAVVAITFRHEILRAFGPVFVTGAQALATLALAHLLRCLLGPWDTLLYLAGHERLVTAITLTSTAALALLCFATVPVYGIMGAAASSACVLVLTAGVGYGMVRVRLGVDPGLSGLIVRRPS